MAVAAAENPCISVVIPALNEADQITPALEALQPLRRRGHEIIVVDGGSHDDTVTLSRPLADRVLQAKRGRALQMRAGVAAASGSIFWFLHADTAAPARADRLILEALRQEQRQWGRFDVQLCGSGWLLQCVAGLMNVRSRLTGIATGDQGIFVSRELYERSGGFPAIPLMEDIALSRALRRECSPACIRQPLATSSRRWRTHGVLRTIMLMWGLRLAYYAGVSPARLARFYAPHQP
jgi:rSAM/selenodomain-associated transferase 2